MESSAHNPLDTLADTLRSHLSRPLRLDADGVRFVTATHGDVEAETLRVVFADTSASDAETLLELLLFPDTAFQVRIEPLLSQLSVGVDQERYLRGCLRQPPINLTLETDNADSRLQIPLPGEFLDRFVTRLMLIKRWPAPLNKALRQHLSEGEQMRVRVMLRNSPVALGDSFTEICGRFLAALTSRHRDFWPALTFLIQLAAELEAAANPFELLKDYKQRAFQMVEQQREFEYRLQRSNIETLLGQGQRVPTLAMAEARKQMRIIDAVSLALFGRTTYFQPAAFG